MFRYKICYECKVWFIGSLVSYSILVLMICRMYYDQVPIIVYLVTLLSFCPTTIFSYLHYRNHQHEQFNKIKNKFGVKWLLVELENL